MLVEYLLDIAFSNRTLRKVNAGIRSQKNSETKPAKTSGKKPLCRNFPYQDQDAAVPEADDREVEVLPRQAEVSHQEIVARLPGRQGRERKLLRAERLLGELRQLFGA